MLFLGVDGGGTGCRAAVVDADGRVLGRGAAGPANIASDSEGAQANILAAARAAVAEAGLPADALPGLRAGLGLAGVNGRGYAERLRAALPFSQLRIASDAVTAVKGALGPADGVVAAVGTGSVFAVQRGGRVRQIGGWGLILGDEGSGAWIGRAILARALRAQDGFVPLTPLLRRLLEERGGADGVVTFSLGARPADFAALAPHVAASDDPAAQAVMTQAARDVAEGVDLLRAGEDLPVVLLGGLAPVLGARLAGRWDLREPRGTSLDGALWLAREGAVEP